MRMAAKDGEIQGEVHGCENTIVPTQLSIPEEFSSEPDTEKRKMG